MTDDPPIDDELEAILAARDASRLDRSRRTLFGLMRALARVRASKRDRGEWVMTVINEANAASEKDMATETFLVANIEAIAPDFLLEGSKHVDVPGAGRIQFTDRKAGLRIADADAFIAGLGADERALLVEQRDHLRTTEAKTYAANVLQESGELIPGTERTEARRDSTISTTSLSERRQQ